jgi:hypothetical protein
VTDAARADFARRLAGDVLGVPGPDPAALAAGDGETILWVDLGERPTAGHSVGLRGDRATVSGDTLVLAVDYAQPAPDAIVAEVLTRPCLVVRVDDAAMRSVRLVADGDTLLEGPIEELGR